jgi:hypothetical protein
MSSKRTIILSMLISGGLAGLGGVVQGLGYFQNYSNQVTSLPIGFDGMAVSLLGNGSSIGILLSAILFSILRSGAAGMQAINVPAEISQIVAASIIFFVGANYIVKYLVEKATKDKAKVAIEVADSTMGIGNAGTGAPADTIALAGDATASTGGALAPSSTEAAANNDDRKDVETSVNTSVSTNGVNTTNKETETGKGGEHS